MLECSELNKILKKQGLDFFSGVPDSTFKDWMNFLSDSHGRGLTNIIAVNECEAVAICAGHYLSTGKIGITYCQNSGLGKMVNPITSLLDREVYSIPVLFMIGWRGEPGLHDEPQHKKMGRITPLLLETLEIPYEFLPANLKEAEEIIVKAKEFMVKTNAPYALIMRRGIFNAYKKNTIEGNILELTREKAIEFILDNLSGGEIIISTTGKTSRELFEYRKNRNQGHERDFLTVGSMGCASSIAFGAALAHPNKKFIIFDGDGSALMQLGSLATIGHYMPKNLYHVIFDNNAHESTGGQPTVSGTMQFEKAALSCGYKKANVVTKKSELIEQIKTSHAGPIVLVIKVKCGSREDLGRPSLTPIENKKLFMNNLKL